MVILLDVSRQHLDINALIANYVLYACFCTYCIKRSMLQKSITDLEAGDIDDIGCAIERATGGRRFWHSRHCGYLVGVQELSLAKRVAKQYYWTKRNLKLKAAKRAKPPLAFGGIVHKVIQDRWASHRPFSGHNSGSLHRKIVSSATSEHVKELARLELALRGELKLYPN